MNCKRYNVYINTRPSVNTWQPSLQKRYVTIILPNCHFCIPEIKCDGLCVNIKLCCHCFSFIYLHFCWWFCYLYSFLLFKAFSLGSLQFSLIFFFVIFDSVLLFVTFKKKILLHDASKCYIWLGFCSWYKAEWHHIFSCLTAQKH